MLYFPYPDNGWVGWSSVNINESVGFTLCMWVKTFSTPEQMNQWFYTGGLGSLSGFYHDRFYGGMILQMGYSGHRGLWGGPGCVDNVWTHVVVSYTDLLSQLPLMYINGTKFSTTTLEGPSGSRTGNWNNIGLGYNTNYQASSYVQDIRIYNRQLSDAEVAWIYGKRSIKNDVPGLVFHAPLLNGTGYKDLVNGITGTTSGTVTPLDNNIQRLK